MNEESPAFRRGSVNRADDRCGTPRGRMAHIRAGEDPCDACREGYAAYFRAYRSSHPAEYRANVANGKARLRAMRRLARLHPDQYAELCREELRILRTAGGPS